MQITSNTPGFVTLEDNLTILIDLDNTTWGEASPQVVAAVKHLCGWFTPDEIANQSIQLVDPNNYRAVAQGYYEKFKKSHPSDAQLLIFLNFISAYYHELRHAHDLLSTTHGQGRLISAFNMFQNGPLLIRSLKEWQAVHGQRIPLPLCDQWQELPSLPAPIQQLAQHYVKTRETEQKLTHPTRQSPSRLSSPFLLESSAISVQKALLRELFDDEAVDFWETGMRQASRQVDFSGEDADTARPYFQIRDELAELFYAKGHREQNVEEIINYLTWCALQSTLQTSTNRSWQREVHPVVFLEALIEEITRDSAPANLPATRKKIELFCQQWQLVPPRDATTRFEGWFREMAALREQGWRRLNPQSQNLLGTALDTLADVFKRLNRKIDSNLSAYFEPQTYFWDVLVDTYPCVPVHVHYKGAINEFLSPGYDILPVPTWTFLAYYSTAISLIMNRKHSNTLNFFEKMCLNILQQDIKFERKVDVMRREAQARASAS